MRQLVRALLVKDYPGPGALITLGNMELEAGTYNDGF